MPQNGKLGAGDWTDINAALRIAASCIEMTALHATLEQWDPRDAKSAQADLRRQAARYRKLANRLRGSPPP